MDNGQVDICVLHQGREAIYAFFSRFFLYQPSQDMFNELASLAPFLSAMAENADNPLMLQGAKGLDQFINKRFCLEETATQDFDKANLADYTRLFCLSDSVALSQSVYVTPDHLVMGAPAGKAAEIYSQHGFAMDLSSNEPYDHISYELMFLAFLAAEIYDAYNSSHKADALKLTAQSASFIDDFPLKWLESFYATLLKFEQSAALYAHGASFLLGYIWEDKALLDELINE